MEERRKTKRTSMPSKLMIKKVGGGSSEVTIDIIDVSKSGICFTCSEPLQIGEVYEAYLTIWTKEVIHTLLQIVRIDLQTDDFGYGAVFMGMSATEASRIEVYQTVSDSLSSLEGK